MTKDKEIMIAAPLTEVSTAFLNSLFRNNKKLFSIKGFSIILLDKPNKYP